VCVIERDPEASIIKGPGPLRAFAPWGGGEIRFLIIRYFHGIKD